MVVPSGLNAATYTVLLCPKRVTVQACVSSDQSETVLNRVVDKNELPSGLKAKIRPCAPTSAIEKALRRRPLRLNDHKVTLLVLDKDRSVAPSELST